MNKNRINDVFGKTLDKDIALSNTITVQAKFNLCDEKEFILYSIMEHLTHCRFIYFNLLIYPHKMDKFMNENALIINKKIKNKETNVIEYIKLKETFKVAFCRVYGISSRQFNSIDFFIKGLIQSNKTLLQDRIISFNDQLRKKINKMDKLKGQIKILKISEAYKNNDDKRMKNKSISHFEIYEDETESFKKIEINEKSSTLIDLIEQVKQNVNLETLDYTEILGIAANVSFNVYLKTPYLISKFKKVNQMIDELNKAGIKLSDKEIQAFKEFGEKNE